MEYYVIKNKTTGEYFRGKGVNRWGKYFNQASVYRIRGTAESSLADLRMRGEDAEIIPIRITETTNEVTEVCHGTWCHKYRSGNPVSEGYVSSCCSMWHKYKTNFCPYCGAIMN